MKLREVFRLVLWSVGVGAYEIFNALNHSQYDIAEKRVSAYGIFNANYGVSWFLGSVIIGFLYNYLVWAVILFSLLAQFTAIPILIRAKNRIAA